MWPVFSASNPISQNVLQCSMVRPQYNYHFMLLDQVESLLHELKADSLSPFMLAAKGCSVYDQSPSAKYKQKRSSLGWNWRSGWQLALYDNKYTGIKTKDRSNLNHIWSSCLHCMFTAQSRGSNYNTGKMDQTRFRSNLPAEDGMSFLTLNTTVPLSCIFYWE